MEWHHDDGNIFCITGVFATCWAPQINFCEVANSWIVGRSAVWFVVEIITYPHHLILTQTTPQNEVCCLHLWKWSVTKTHSRNSPSVTGDPLHSRALAHSRAPLFTQPCPHCSHSRAPGEQWAWLCVFTLQGRVQTARLCRGSPVSVVKRPLTNLKSQ